MIISPWDTIFKANPNGANITGTFYSYSDSGVIESDYLLFSGQYRNSPFYLNMLSTSEGQTIKSYAARFTENPCSFAMRLAGTLDIDYFDQELIALHGKHHAQLQSALSVQLIYPESSVISEGNLPTMPLESEFYIVPVQGFNEPEKVILTARQETGGSNFVLEIAPYGENQFLFSGFILQTIYLNFLNYPSLTLSNFPDSYFGFDALASFTEKPANALEDRTASVFAIYPNPAESEIYVGSQPNNSTYSILEMTGKEIKKGSLQNQQSILVTELPSGMYILKLTDNISGQNTSQKFVKQ